MSQHVSRPARRLVTGLAVAALPAVALVTAAAPAHAATPAQASVVAGTVLAYGGGVGQFNNLRIFLENGQLTVTDNAPLTVGPGCSLVATGKARCGTGITGISMALGDLNDQVRIDAPLQGFVSGQDGDDTFLPNPTGPGFSQITYDGGPGLHDRVSYALRAVGVEVSLDDQPNDTGGGHRDNVRSTVEHLVGTAGFDTLIGSSARNFIEGGLGNDTLRGLGDTDTFITGFVADGADSISGGDGVDFVSYGNRGRGVQVDTDNVADDGEPGERDNVGLDVEGLNGTEFDDTLFGGPAANNIEGRGGVDFIFGSGGADLIFPGDGGDRVFGGTGEDRLLFNRDGDADVLDCGTERDTVNREAGLDAVIGCEVLV
jgi:Ca2+-binding RTX toxin-like protein